MAAVSIDPATLANPHPTPPRIVRRPPVEYPTLGPYISKMGDARLELTVSPAGRVIHCDVVKQSGYPELDKTACSSFAKEKEEPARDETGRPMYGTVAITISFQLRGEGFLSTPPTDLSLVVNSLPVGNVNPTRRSVELKIDENGNFANCWGSSGSPMPTDKLEGALCSMAAHRLAFKPAYDEDNRPVVTIRSLLADFSTENPPKVSKPIEASHQHAAQP